MEVSEVFEASSSSVGKLLEGRSGFYVPSYQRYYSWDVKNIDRLVEDIVGGTHLLLQYPDAITFIGALITIHDNENKTVQPQVRNDLPEKVLVVIDGQQRLSTLQVISTVLHEELSRCLSKIKSDEDEAKWLVNQCKDVIAALYKVFCMDMERGAGVYQYYPRLIRAHEDVWSRNDEGEEATYESPVAHYLHNYISYIYSKESKKFKYESPGLAASDLLVRNLRRS